MSDTATPPLISFPAGRCFRRSPNEKWVDPHPEKGLLELKYENELLNLWWKSRVTGNVEDDLIIFPGEAVFEKVPQDTSGRTYILKFSSSDQKYFFWFQKADREEYARIQTDVNNLLLDPTYELGSAPTQPSTPPQEEERSWPPTPGAPRLANAVPGPPRAAAAAAPVIPPPQAGSSSTAGLGQGDIARMLAEWASQGGLNATQGEDARLTDVLSPINISTLLSVHPNLIPSLKANLPPNLHLSETPSAQELLPILSAPQFTDAIASLDNALRSGGLPGSMMTELGLPESAGRGVKEFLDALKGLHKAEGEGEGGGGGGGGDDRMDTD